jgi:hypothetical protein
MDIARNFTAMTVDTAADRSSGLRVRSLDLQVSCLCLKLGPFPFRVARAVDQGELWPRWQSARADSTVWPCSDGTSRTTVGKICR